MSILIFSFENISKKLKNYKFRKFCALFLQIEEYSYYYIDLIVMFDEITTFVIPIKAVPRLQRRAALLILKPKYCFNYFFVSLIIFSNIYFIIFIKSL